jgi:hypothetical protein
METNNNTEEKTIYIKRMPRKLPINVGFLFEDLMNDDVEGYVPNPFKEVCILPDGTVVRIDPNSKLTWKDVQEKYY